MTCKTNPNVKMHGYTITGVGGLGLGGTVKPGKLINSVGEISDSVSTTIIGDVISGPTRAEKGVTWGSTVGLEGGMIVGGQGSLTTVQDGSVSRAADVGIFGIGASGHGGFTRSVVTSIECDD